MPVAQCAESGQLRLVDPVAVFGRREHLLPNFLRVLGDPIGHRVLQVGVPADELRADALPDAEQIVEHQYLSVGGRAGADADDRDRHLGHQFHGQRARHGLEDDAEAPGFLQPDRPTGDP